MINPIRELQTVPAGFERKELKRLGSVLEGPRDASIRWTVLSQNFGGPGGPAFEVFGHYRTKKANLSKWFKTLEEAVEVASA